MVGPWLSMVETIGLVVAPYSIIRNVSLGRLNANQITVLLSAIKHYFFSRSTEVISIFLSKAAALL